MILIGTTAAGFALARTMLEETARMRLGLMWLTGMVTSMLLVWTVTLLVLRLQRPRPTLHRLICQPGMAACLAAVLVTTIDTINWSIHWVMLDPRNALLRMLLPPVYWPGHTHHVGQAVAVTWLGLLLSRRWRPKPGWIDRFGRLIGVFWLMTMLIDSRLIGWAFCHPAALVGKAMSHDAPAIATDHPAFGPIDAMILLVSIALGIGLSATDPKDLESALGLGNSHARFEKEKDWTMIRRIEGPGPGDSARIERVWVLDRFRWKRRVLLGFGQVFLPLVTLGAGLATFRHRAARSRRSIRHIGILTTAVASIFCALTLLNEYMLRRFYDPRTNPGHGSLDEIWWDLGQCSGLAIAALWVVLALGRSWRAAPDWTDRLGRLIGASWVVSTVAALMFIYVLMLRRGPGARIGLAIYPEWAPSWIGFSPTRLRRATPIA